MSQSKLATVTCFVESATKGIMPGLALVWLFKSPKIWHIYGHQTDCYLPVSQLSLFITS